MRPTLLLLSLVAIALISGTEAFNCALRTCPRIYPLPPCTRKGQCCCSGGVTRLRFLPGHISRDELDDEEAGGFSVEAGYEKDGKYAKIKYEKDEMDDEMEDYCTPDNFYSFIEKAYTTSPHMPRYKDMPEWVKVCTKDIFNEVCDECEDDVNCIMTRGRDVSLTMPECHQPRRLALPPCARVRCPAVLPRRCRLGEEPKCGGCCGCSCHKSHFFDELDDESVGSMGCMGHKRCGDEMDDEAVGSWTMYYPPNHPYHVKRREEKARKAECATKGPRYTWAHGGCQDCEDKDWKLIAQEIGCPSQYWD